MCNTGADVGRPRATWLHSVDLKGAAVAQLTAAAFVLRPGEGLGQMAHPCFHASYTQLAIADRRQLY